MKTKAKVKNIKPQDHPLWEAFCEWAADNAIDPNDHPDDWMPSWECFLAGAIALANGKPYSYR